MFSGGMVTGPALIAIFLLAIAVLLVLIIKFKLNAFVSLLVTAFGTGMHETTQLCIRQIRKYVKEGTKILDVGCGSGILGMLALKFGAAYSVGTDLDPCAIEATRENMEVNGIRDDQYEVMIGNIIDDKAVQDKVGYDCYDIVAANILADVLVQLTPVVVNQLKPGGI